MTALSVGVASGVGKAVLRSGLRVGNSVARLKLDGSCFNFGRAKGLDLLLLLQLGSRGGRETSVVNITSAAG